MEKAPANLAWREILTAQFSTVSAPEDDFVFTQRALTRFGGADIFHSLTLLTLLSLLALTIVSTSCIEA